MDEVHRLIVQTEIVTAYALGLITFLTFLLVGFLGYLMYDLRKESRKHDEWMAETRREREKSRHEWEETRERLSHFSHYLFGKLYPLDTK